MPAQPSAFYSKVAPRLVWHCRTTWAAGNPQAACRTFPAACPAEPMMPVSAPCSCSNRNNTARKPCPHRVVVPTVQEYMLPPSRCQSRCSAAGRGGATAMPSKALTCSESSGAPGWERGHKVAHCLLRKLCSKQIVNHKQCFSTVGGAQDSPHPKCPWRSSGHSSVSTDALHAADTMLFAAARPPAVFVLDLFSP